jgi:hypothetical protein
MNRFGTKNGPGSRKYAVRCGPLICDYKYRLKLDIFHKISHKNQCAAGLDV